MGNVARRRLLPVVLIPLVTLVGLASLFLSTGASTPQSVQVNASASDACVMCHSALNPSIVEHWDGSRHAENGVGCLECHAANEADADAFNHNGNMIAVIVTPRDCSRCHEGEYEEFTRSHHAAAGNILASLDNLLAETIEGARADFAPVSPTPGRPDLTVVKGNASVVGGCAQCHGSKLALLGKDGSKITMVELAPDDDGVPTNADAVANILRDDDGKPMFDPMTWPNTGIGRLNLDGSPGSCTACHSRHDFSSRRARLPKNCGKCHMGPDHPQLEIYEESKHGIAFNDYRDEMNMDSEDWVLGEDYNAAPTCATCHMSGNTTDPKPTHDIGLRLSWNNRPVKSLWYDTDADGKIIKTEDDTERAELLVDSGWDKRERMVDVCMHCHTETFVDGFYEQYDSFILLYNEKFAKPGAKLMSLLKEHEVITTPNFDDEIEWVWFELWHHEGRRARHGASMMGPDYAHWHGMYEVARNFYTELVPLAREAAEEAAAHGNTAGAAAVIEYLDSVLASEEHAWFMAEREQ